MLPTQQNAEATVRHLEALELRIAGCTFEQIAAKVGYADKSGAWKAVKSALELTLQPAADELRELESQRLDKLWNALFDRAAGGDEKVIDRMIKISERRSKLLGLDMPISVRIQPDMGGGAPPIEPTDYRQAMTALAPLDEGLPDDTDE